VSARERGTTATSTWRRWIVAHGVLVVVTAAFVFFVPGGAPALLTVPANLLHVLGASAIVLLPVSLLSGWRKTAALQSLALAAGIGGVLGGADPFGTAQSDAGQGRLRIVSVNLGVGLAEPEDV
jgi:hypothetical protein